MGGVDYAFFYESSAEMKEENSVYCFKNGEIPIKCHNCRELPGRQLFKSLIFITKQY